MALSISTAAIVCMIACHGGPADHFATFAENLKQKGYEVQIYASGPALKKIQEHHIQAFPFSVDHLSLEEETKLADQIAKSCSAASVVLTDVGHSFDISLQKSLSIQAPRVTRIAYYDNPEPYVPGGYSSIAAKVMLAAQRVLFANSNLTKTPIYQAPSHEINLATEKKIGLGYYPINQAEKIAKRRASDHKQIRAQLFSKYFLEERNQKVLVYAGGNNDEYFSKAFPAFLQFLEEAAKQTDLSNIVVLLQQHPGARENNLDAKLVQHWMDQHGQESKAPRLFISELNSDDAQVVADGMLYYQTSMGPQFVLAGIPTIQVGHNTYEDILVKKGLCSVARNVNGLLNALTHLQRDGKLNQTMRAIRQGLGINSDWADRLEHTIKTKSNQLFSHGLRDAELLRGGSERFFVIPGFLQIQIRTGHSFKILSTVDPNSPESFCAPMITRSKASF